MALYRILRGAILVDRRLQVVVLKLDLRMVPMEEFQRLIVMMAQGLLMEALAALGLPRVAMEARLVVHLLSLRAF